MRLVGRVLYGMAAAMGLLSLGAEWQARQRQGQARRLFAPPHPPSHTGMFVALWAGIVALLGKVLEDAGERQRISAKATGSRRSTGFGSYRPYLPQPLQRAKTSLRSDFDLGDQYVEPRSNAQPLTIGH